MHHEGRFGLALRLLLDHRRDRRVVEVRGLAGLREDVLSLPGDHEGDRVRLLVARRELGPERGFEGQRAQAAAEGHHRVPVPGAGEVLERRLDLLRLPRAEEVAERLELLAERVQFRRGAAARGRGHRQFRHRVFRRQGLDLLFDQLDGIGQALVRMAQHRREDGVPVPFELPAEQLEGGVILLGHPFSGLVNKQGLQKPFRAGLFRRREAGGANKEYLPR